MNLIRILAFLFIFGLVMNGLAVLNIASTSFATNPEMEVDPDVQMGLLTTQVMITLIIGLGAAMATWIALSVKVLGSGGGGNVPMDKLFAYGVFGGLITISLWGGLSCVWNVYEIMPGETKIGGAVMLAIIIAIVGFVATLGFVELTTGRDLI